VAVHRLMARTPSRLFVAQMEDLVGSIDQVNIPGTIDEHPNWRRKLPLDIEELPKNAFFRAITKALREERPKFS
jgi:4-alpha-glucanotransferase